MNINFNKNKDGLVPVVIQDDRTLQVLMLGYMNEEALKNRERRHCYFFSAVQKTGFGQKEKSLVTFNGKNISVDCDQDAILIKVIPTNVVCHTGSFSCFGEKDSKGFYMSWKKRSAGELMKNRRFLYLCAIPERN